MGQTKEGAAKAYQTKLKKYGPEKLKEWQGNGGRVKRPRSFEDKDLARTAGRKGALKKHKQNA